MKNSEEEEKRRLSYLHNQRAIEAADEALKVADKALEERRLAGEHSKKKNKRSLLNKLFKIE